MSSNYSGILKVRESYFNGLIDDYDSYSPDYVKMTRGYLPKANILDPYLNERVALAYEEMTDSSRNGDPDQDQKHELYKKIIGRVVQHVQYKKEHTTQETIIHFDIWTRLFSIAKTKQEAQNYLNMSDHWEDFICLANLAIEYPNENATKHLNIRLDQLLNMLPTYTHEFKNGPELTEKFQTLLKSIKELFSQKNYIEVQKNVNKLQDLIRVKEIKV